MTTQPPSPGGTQLPSEEWPPPTPYVHYGIRIILLATQYSLRNYLEEKRHRIEFGSNAVEAAMGLDEATRQQSAIVLDDLRELRAEVAGIACRADRRRWTRAVALARECQSIPFPCYGMLARRYTARSRETVANRCASRLLVVPRVIELTAAVADRYYFSSTRSTKSRLAATRTVRFLRYWTRQMAYYVPGFALAAFALLHVTQNELLLSVSRTMLHRLDGLYRRIEAGGDDVSESDEGMLHAWRWRILLSNE